MSCPLVYIVYAFAKICGWHQYSFLLNTCIQPYSCSIAVVGAFFRYLLSILLLLPCSTSLHTNPMLILFLLFLSFFLSFFLSSIKKSRFHTAQNIGCCCCLLFKIKNAVAVGPGAALLSHCSGLLGWDSALACLCVLSVESVESLLSDTYSVRYKTYVPHHTVTQLGVPCRTYVPYGTSRYDGWDWKIKARS